MKLRKYYNPEEELTPDNLTMRRAGELQDPSRSTLRANCSQPLPHLAHHSSKGSSLCPFPLYKPG